MSYPSTSHTPAASQQPDGIVSLHGFRPDLEYGCRCDVCPLGPRGVLKDPTTPWAPVRGEFHANATVLAVAENPADEEVKVGRPLVGRSGAQAWNPALEGIGRKRPDVDLDNSISCQPPGEASGAYARMERAVKKINDDLVKEGKPVWPTPAECCKPRLERVVSNYRNLIALGGTAAKALTGDGTKILSARGDVREIPSSDPATPRRVVLTLHPSFVLRAPHYREFFEADLAKAFRWFEGKRNWTEPIYEWKPTPSRLREWLRQPARFTVHDYETTMDGPIRSRIYCVGFARLVEPAEWRQCEKCNGTGKRLTVFDKDTGWNPAPFHLHHLPCECCGGQGTRLVEVHSVLVPFMSCEDPSRRFYTPEEEPQVVEAIREHMLDPNAWKVFHNGWGFDQVVTESHFGVSPWPSRDTLPIARHRNPAVRKGLKVIGSILCDIHAWGASTEGVRIAEAPKSDRQLHLYCASGDASVNAKIYDQLVKDAEARGYFRPLKEELKPKGWPASYPWTLAGVDQRRQEMCRHMYRAGFFVDQARRAEHEVILDKEAAKYKFIARKYAHEQGVHGKVHTRKGRGGDEQDNRVDLFNPGSDKQVASLVFDVWGIAPVVFSKETGQASVDDEVLRGILTSPELPPDRRAFLDAIRRYRRARKAKSTFVTPLQRRDLWQPKINKKGNPVGEPPLCWEDGRVRSSWSAMLTSVARLSSREPNLQNVPPRFRDQFCAPPGFVLIGGDVDQFHLRIIANRWRIGRLLQAFRDGVDPHSALAEDWFGATFRNADGWGPDGFSLKRKPKKDSAADRMRHLSKIIRYRGAYADTEEGLLQTVRKVEDPDTGDMPFGQMSLREVKRLYRIWMRAEPEWEGAWQWVMDQYQRNGGWIEECVFGRRSGDLEGGKKQAVVNYDILGAEPPIFTLIEENIRQAFPDDFEGPGTGMVHQGHDAAEVCTRGRAWVEVRDGRKVVVCDPETERKRLQMQEAMNVDLSRVLGWEIPITSACQVGPVIDEKGNAKLSNWKEA